MPGHSHRADVTEVLRRQGSWPSYNIPYFRDIWAVGGYGEMQLKRPKNADRYSYERTFRALMFARERTEGTVTSLATLMEFIRYNRPNDPLAGGNACNGISARCDLNPTWHPAYDCFGAVDAKVIGQREDVTNLSFYAVASPSHENGERSFSWGEQDTTVDGCGPSQHLGQPNTFNFDWLVLPSNFQDLPRTAAADNKRSHHGDGNEVKLTLFGACSLIVLLGVLSRRSSGVKTSPEGYQPMESNC
ncbi:unnamed protein product [Polarella glacialis]|uniref:Phospholipase B-like n=1 Tax=Polarella glacialis TaxID=89957 RepID=A0A813HHN9_POLGL|nr:unnamed protein product [Polarella glacialis]